MEQNVQNAGTTTKEDITHIMGIPGGEGRKKGREEIFAVMITENFPKLMSDTKSQIQEAQGTTSRISANKQIHKPQVRTSYSNFKKTKDKSCKQRG